MRKRSGRAKRGDPRTFSKQISPVVLVLHNIRSVYNVGSIFRTADAAGVEKIFLTGYTPAPLDRFGRERKDLSKVALGAEKAMPWTQSNSIAHAIKLVKQEGYFVAAVEQDKSSISLFEFANKSRRAKAVGTPTKASEKLALVLGNEVRGLSKSSLKLCDAIVEIPMRGHKESLNVSVAAGIVIYSLL